MKRRSKGVRKRRVARRISRKAAKRVKRVKRAKAKHSVSKRFGKPARRARHARHARPARRVKARQKQPRLVRKAAKAVKPAAAVSAPLQKAAAEVPTLEQVTITCANCGKPFRLFKLKGLSLEGTICQRCSLGEVELPESFG